MFGVWPVAIHRMRELYGQACAMAEMLEFAATVRRAAASTPPSSSLSDTLAFLDAHAALAAHLPHPPAPVARTHARLPCSAYPLLCRAAQILLLCALIEMHPIPSAGYLLFLSLFVGLVLAPQRTPRLRAARAFSPTPQHAPSLRYSPRAACSSA